MNSTRNNFGEEHGPTRPDRRDLLVTGLGLAAVSLLSRIPAGAQSQQAGGPARGGDAPADKSQLTKTDRRKLGSLEVSSLGLGCMSMAGFVALIYPGVAF